MYISLNIKLIQAVMCIFNLPNTYSHGYLIFSLITKLKQRI